MKSAVLFDLDGTLTDPKPGITRSIAYALERMGRPVPDLDTLTWCIGPPLALSFQTLLGCDDPVETQRAVDFYRERFGDVGMFENSVYEGVPEMLSAVAALNRVFVATSKPIVFAERIVEHFGLRSFFDGLYGSELDGRLADKGDLISHVLRAESISAEAATMVGDREHDVLGARRADVPCVGVLYGYGTVEELRAAGAAVLCRTPAEVAELLVTRCT